MANEHAQSPDAALKSQGSNKKGLSSQEAKKRLQEHGSNELKETKPVSPWAILIGQFNSVVMWILIAATAISGLLHEYIDAIVILIILILIAILGFIQEYKAEKAIEALKRLASLKATVIRDGKRQEVDSKDIVPGDIIALETGNKVPADARIIDSHNLQIQEAALTGESQPVKKSADKVTEKTMLAERSCMVYSSTIVVSGKATAVVTGTGMETEIGKIATMIQEAKPEPTPLQRKMDRLGRLLGKVTLAVVIIVFLEGIFRDDIAVEHLLSGDLLAFFADAKEIFITAVALAVAAIPEGLPAVVTISLALGTKRMLKRHALIRRLPSVETLGSTTVICTDKTGTLTRNEMTVRKIYANDKIIDVTGSGYGTKGDFLVGKKKLNPKDISELLIIGAANNDAELKDNTVMGDPTEGALLVTAAKAGYSKKAIDSQFPRKDEIEFTSERKMMTTIHQHHGEKLAFVKGAPEMVLKKCDYILINGKTKKLTPAKKREILKLNEEFADDALRVLAFAKRTVMYGRTETKLTFVGMQAMIDPPREEVKVAVKQCAQAGIRVVMITGDNGVTAKAVAKEIGLKGKVMTGAELEKVKDLSKVVESIGVFARVNPEHKLKIVDALKKKGHIVAMTGDGVNDAPALKRSDIGVAMGITGTDVSKEASAMILTDDNFASIVNAVEEGRGTYDNIRKYFAFLISGNIGEVLIIFLGILFGLPLPLTATQILLINLVTDGLPALALSADPFEPRAMTRKPRKQDEPIYKGLNAYLISYPLTMTAVALSVFSFFYFTQGNLLKAQTATFLTIAMFELYQGFACRSTIYPSFKVGLFKNKWLIAAVGGSFAVVAGVIFITPLGQYLDMFPLSIMEFVVISLLSSAGAIVIELSKMVGHKEEEHAAA